MSKKRGLEITVVDVFLSKGLDPDKRATWAVGNMARLEWASRHRRPPRKELRPKTNGKGSHCFAVYPESFRAKIEEFIAKVSPPECTQTSLF